MEVIEQTSVDVNGKQGNEILLEQWKIYVQMADNISSRRAKSNTFFTTINTTVIGVCTTGFVGVDKNLILITGVLISIAWLLSIRSYAMLNQAKFKIINKIEESLPVQGFTNEWEELKGKRYFKLTSNEFYVPIAFIVIYIIYLYNNGAFLYLLNLIK